MQQGTVDFTWLPEAMQAELTELAARFGSPLTGSADLGDSSYLRRVVERRLAEVCMVVRRPGGRLLVFRKPFYPAGIFRLLTGGVEPEEPILDALLREVNEETGLTTRVERFLAASAYLGDGRPQFASFAFLLDERSGTLGALDQDEQVEAFREVEPAHLVEMAEHLERLPNERNDVLDDNIHDWGLLRALNHRLVWQALHGSG
jgi:8-oxo-dGTP pyrophosphatase MutT (NUDIX family)